MAGRPRLAALLLRWFGLRLPGDATVRVRDVDLGSSMGGRLWRSDRDGPGVVLAAGITPRGNDDPRLVRLADALARSGWWVLSPALALAEHRLEPQDVDRIATAIRVLADDRHTGGKVAAVGFSFGGSFLLCAATRPEVREHLATVGAFGAYAHLENLVPQARRMGADAIRAALEQLDAAVLDEQERTALEEVLLGDAFVAHLPDGLRRRFDDLSPVTCADRIDAPVTLLHAAGDAVIPDSELDRLAEALPRARVHRVESFTHVDFRPTPRRAVQALRDIAALSRFAGDVLGPRYVR